MKKSLPSLIAAVALLGMYACSESGTNAVEEPDPPPVKEWFSYHYLGNGPDNNKTLQLGIRTDCIEFECSETFEKFDFSQRPVMESTTGVNGGKALVLKDSQYILLPWELNKQIDVGSLDFYFKPGANFSEMGYYALVGNDGARLNVMYSNGELYFYKNLSDNIILLKGNVSLKKNDWNRITAEWNADSGFMALFLNGSQIAVQKVEYPYYSPSPTERSRIENIMAVGYKGNCCMGSKGSAFGEGSFDNIKIVTKNIFSITAPAE